MKKVTWVILLFIVWAGVLKLEMMMMMMIHCILAAAFLRVFVDSILTAFFLLEEATTTNEVINQLLHHVGAMCIHQLNLLAASNNLPITNFLGKQHPIEAHHLSSICDIMEKAMVNGDTCIIRCILVVFQVQRPLKCTSQETLKKVKSCFSRRTTT